MAGLEATGTQFAEPIESSVYFFDHYRFDTAAVRVAAQDRGLLRVVGTVAGDIDGLGIGHAEFDAWLPFTGIIVALSDRPKSVEAAEVELARFTTTAGLVGSAESSRYVFVPGPT